MNNFLKSLPLIVFLFAGSTSNAEQCVLKGVEFSGLSGEQVSALTASGGKCNKTGTPSALSFGDKGYFVIDGKKVEFIDIIAEDPYDLNKTKFTLYGYIDSYVQEAKRDKIWGYRFDTKVGEGGEYYKNLKQMGFQTDNDTISLLAIARSSKQTVAEAKEARKSLVKFFNKARGSKAIVKISGTMKNWSNTGDLYLDMETWQIIEMGG